MTVRHVVVEPFGSRKCRDGIFGRTTLKKGGWRDGTGKTQSRERLQKDGFNDTKYKIVLTLDRLKAP